jgi:hypothetical protein
MIGNNLQQYRRELPLWERKIFGFPLKNVSGKRHTSPLLLRITQLQGEQYVGIAVLFKTKWKEKEFQFSDYKHIDNWIDSFPGRDEIRL